MNSSFIQIVLEKDEVMQALTKALDYDFIDNLRHRHQHVMLDSKLRGFVGEIAFEKWLNEQGIEIESSNLFDDEKGIDVDFICKGLKIELKTSLLPDIDECIERAIEKRDIKLIRRKKQQIEDLEGDIHVQLIFNQLRLRKDEWLKKQSINFDSNLEDIYHQMACFRYEKDCYFVGWIDKTSLINQLKNKPQHMQKWKYGMRQFWCCNIAHDSKKPGELKSYLHQICP